MFMLVTGTKEESMKLDFDNKDYIFGNKVYPNTAERDEMLKKLIGRHSEINVKAAKKSDLKTKLVTAVMLTVMALCFVFLLAGKIKAALGMIGAFFCIIGILIFTEDVFDKTDNSLISNRIYGIPFLATGALLIICSITKASENLIMMFCGFVFLFAAVICFTKFIQQYEAEHFEPNAEVVGYVWKASDPEAPMPFLIGTPMFEYNLYGELYRAFDPKYTNVVVSEKMGEKYLIKIDGKDPYKITYIPKISNEKGIGILMLIFGIPSAFAALFLLLFPMLS